MHTCRICGWTGNADIITIPEMQYGTREEFNYFECKNCHCLQITEIPENLFNYYGNTYYSYQKPSVEKTNSEQPPNTISILDVGCGAGELLCKLAQKGYTNLTGCDPFIENDIVYENGVHIFKRSIHEMTGQFDGILLNDSFEHVTDPHEVMTSIKRLLAPNGVAKICIPVYPNIAFDLFKEYWFQLDAPRHIFLHTRESMQHLAKKHGFVISEIEYNSNLTQIVHIYLYSVGISLWEHTEEVISQYFTEADLNSIEQSCETANKNKYGDHAIFYLTHA